MKGIIIGGDLRNGYIYKELKDRGFDLYEYGVWWKDEEGLVSAIHPTWDKREVLNRLKECDCIVLPVPVTRDGIRISSMNNAPSILLEEIKAELLSRNQHEEHHPIYIFGGNIPDGYFENINGAKQVDYMKSNGIALQNAVATAEGVICEAIKLSDYNLSGKTALLLGYGRCGKVLANRLKAMNMDLTVLVRRNESMYEAKALGYKCAILANFNKKLNYDYIFNTIPGKVLTEKQLESISDQSLVLEIASGEGGFGKEWITKWNGRYANLKGMPGKYAPAESGKILAEFIMNHIERRRDGTK